MAIGAALRVPVRVAEHYVRPGDEQRLFPNFPAFLTREDVQEVWPLGLITHEKFQHNGSIWRLVKRPMAQGNSVYMAVLDDALSNGCGGGGAGTPGRAAHNSCMTPDIGPAERLRSMPIDAFSSSHDGPDVTGGCSDITPAYASQQNSHSFQHVASMPAIPAAHGHGYSQRSITPSNLGGSSMRDRSGAFYSSMALVASQPSGALSFPSASFAMPNGGSGFMTDLLAATESPRPLDRFKAFIRLFSSLRVAIHQLGLPAPTPSASRVALEDPAWDSPDAQDLVRQVIMVGECLTKFGTADFVDGSNNSSRAITTKDYAKLLRMYLEEHGAVFQDDFISRMPHELQVDAIAVRALLQTRCETNDMLFNQLVKHVGQEPANGGAMVINTTSAHANPTNHMLSAPRTLVNTVSNAWSKADVKRRTQMGAVGAVAVVMLWVLKRKLFGGGRRARSASRDDSDWATNSRRSSRSRGGSTDLAGRLMDERSSAERMAVRFLSACQDELRRSQMNDQLLRNDWRLGPLRLAAPGSGPVPQGYEPVQSNYCSLASYMNALDGGAPFAMPYTFPERLLSSGGGSSARESSAGAPAE